MENLNISGMERIVPPFGFLADEKIKNAYRFYAPRFGVYKDGVFTERNLPFDATPRIITAEEFEYLRRGLVQRVTALNMFLEDIYGDCKVIADGVIPSEFLFASQGFLPQCVGIKPSRGIYAHIAGIDLVKNRDGKWYVLEDNLRVPSGASYPLTARRAFRDCNADGGGVADSMVYADMLKELFGFVSRGGIDAVLTSGYGNCAFYEHAYMAEVTGSALCGCDDLFVDNDVLYFRGADGVMRVGTLYSRVDSAFSDPLAFRSVSVVGVPNLFSAYAAGNVALVNAYGCGAADDKGIYAFVPKLIRYYLGESPILDQPPTYLPTDSADRKFIDSHFDSLVIKEVSESGGYGVVFVSALSKEEKRRLREQLNSVPRNFIAQEVIDFEELITENGLRRADFRAFVLSGERVKVWESGLTRFASGDTLIVNSSQGGGFKDTWVLSH